MTRIKNYFRDWDAVRIFRLVLASVLGAAYVSNGETVFLFVAILLLVQAVFNISCPGGSCAPAKNKDAKQIVEVKKYEPDKTK